MCAPHKLDSSTSVAMARDWTIHICPTTGGNFDLSISSNDTIDGLKKAIGKKLRIPKERISLLFKERYVALSIYMYFVLNVISVLPHSGICFVVVGVWLNLAVTLVGSTEWLGEIERGL